MKESKVLEIVECTGTAYEIGLQYGEARKANLQKTLKLCIDKLVNFANAANVKLTREEILTMAGKCLPMVSAIRPIRADAIKLRHLWRYFSLQKGTLDSQGTLVWQSPHPVSMTP